MLHVVNGAVLPARLRAAGLSGVFSEFADVLHEGPVRFTGDFTAHLEERARFIAECGWATPESALERMRAWQQPLENFRDYDDVVLWYEHDLFDQLLLIRHLAWWWQHAPVDPPQLVSPADYLGHMTSAQLLRAHESRERVSEAQLTLASDAWAAFTASTPNELLRLVQRQNLAALPHLHAALQRLLEEFPSAQNGLGRTEQQILSVLQDGARGFGELFTASSAREERVFMGDSVFELRLERMLRAAQPLIERSGGEFSITDAGRRVLTGELDDVAVNDLDRWIGGVHLTRARHWRWTGETLTPGGA